MLSILAIGLLVTDLLVGAVLTKALSSGNQPFANERTHILWKAQQTVATCLANTAMSIHNVLLAFQPTKMLVLQLCVHE